MTFASYTQPPFVYDPAALRKAGLQPKGLTGEDMQRLREIGVFTT